MDKIIELLQKYNDRNYPDDRVGVELIVFSDGSGHLEYNDVWIFSFENTQELEEKLFDAVYKDSTDMKYIAELLRRYAEKNHGAISVAIKFFPDLSGEVTTLFTTDFVFNDLDDLKRQLKIRS